jgi:hypothetical protein
MENGQVTLMVLCLNMQTKLEGQVKGQVIFKQLGARVASENSNEESANLRANFQNGDCLVEFFEDPP